MSVIDDALRSLRERLEEIERESAHLRAAVAAIEATQTRPSAAPPRERAHVASQATPTVRKRPRGENRRKILAAINGEAKTAGEIEAQTGIPAATAATTLYKLMRAGEVRKAARGYIAVDGF